MATEPLPEEPSKSEPSNPTAKTDKKVRLIDELARRSAGLPDTTGTAKSGGSGQPEKSPWSYAGAGLQFAATSAIFAFMGYYLDRRFGWTPWGVITLSCIGVIGGMYLLIKESLKDQGK